MARRVLHHGEALHGRPTSVLRGDHLGLQVAVQQSPPLKLLVHLILILVNVGAAGDEEVFVGGIGPILYRMYRWLHAQPVPDRLPR